VSIKRLRRFFAKQISAQKKFKSADFRPKTRPPRAFSPPKTAPQSPKNEQNFVFSAPSRPQLSTPPKAPTLTPPPPHSACRGNEMSGAAGRISSRGSGGADKVNEMSGNGGERADRVNHIRRSAGGIRKEACEKVGRAK